MLLVGLVRRPHGLRGEVSVEVLTDFPERFVPGSEVRWRRGAQERLLRVSQARSQGGRVLLGFEGIEGPVAAAGLAGGELSVPEEERVPAPLDFYYSHQVEGWRCEDTSGRLLGIVRRLGQTAAGPLLEIATSGNDEVLVPFVRPIVAAIDPDARRIVLDPPEGLLEL